MESVLQAKQLVTFNVSKAISMRNAKNRRTLACLGALEVVTIDSLDLRLFFKLCFSKSPRREGFRREEIFQIHVTQSYM